MKSLTRKVGRPSGYLPEYCEKLIEHMKEGYSFEAFGAICDASKETMYTWLEKHTEFLDAKKKGESYSRYEWEKIGKLGATGQIPDFNSGAWIFNMKNRFKWTDKVEVDNKGASTVNINYSLVDSGS